MNNTIKSFSHGAGNKSLAVLVGNLVSLTLPILRLHSSKAQGWKDF